MHGSDIDNRGSQMRGKNIGDVISDPLDLLRTPKTSQTTQDALESPERLSPASDCPRRAITHPKLKRSREALRALQSKSPSGSVRTLGTEKTLHSVLPRRGSQGVLSLDPDVSSDGLAAADRRASVHSDLLAEGNLDDGVGGVGADDDPCVVLGAPDGVVNAHGARHLDGEDAGTSGAVVVHLEGGVAIGSGDVEEVVQLA